MTENQNKIVELHKSVVTTINLINDISICEDIQHAFDCEYLIGSLLPLIQHNTEELLEANGLQYINSVTKNGTLMSDYYEQAKVDTSNKEENNDGKSDEFTPRKPSNQE